MTGSSTRILRYVEDLKRGSNAEVGPKDYFEIASNLFQNELLYSCMVFTERRFVLSATIPLHMAMAPAMVVVYGILNFMVARLITYPFPLNTLNQQINRNMAGL